MSGFNTSTISVMISDTGTSEADLPVATTYRNELIVIPSLVVSMSVAYLNGTLVRIHLSVTNPTGLPVASNMTY